MILKSCPFCGSAGKATKDEAGDWMVFCSSNDCEAAPMIVHKATQEEAADAWNARVPGTDALALLRELNDALAIPERFQARVDAVLDRAEEK